MLEGMNSVIQSAKRQARGFSNLEYFKTVVYLKLGKLHFPPDGHPCYPLKPAKSHV